MGLFLLKTSQTSHFGLLAHHSFKRFGIFESKVRSQFANLFHSKSLAKFSRIVYLGRTNCLVLSLLLIDSVTDKWKLGQNAFLMCTKNFSRSQYKDKSWKLERSGFSWYFEVIAEKFVYFLNFVSVKTINFSAPKYLHFLRLFCCTIYISTKHC